MAETLNDGLLKQQRETLHFLQGDNKEITAKLVRTESALDELKSGQKQLSLDVHVSRTKGEQKLDSIQKDLKSLSGSTSSSFRGLNVMVPQTKTMQDRLVDMTDYLVKNHQFHERMEGDTRVLEAATNSEDRLVRLESSMMACKKTLSDVSEQMQQVRECQTMMQDQCQVILDRTPKTAETTSSGRGSSTAADLDVQYEHNAAAAGTIGTANGALATACAPTTTRTSLSGCLITCSL